MSTSTTSPRLPNDLSCCRGSSVTDVASDTFNVLSLCSGYGGLDLAVGRAVRGARTVCYVEREAYAAAILAARMADGGLDRAPVWSDLSTFDGRRWRGVVDLVAAGFPCQDISHAGKRVGIDGERSSLWKQVVRVLGECGARYVFLENVAALVGRGLDVVLADLASLGFDAEWGCYTAREVGAPHRRERIFILADSDGTAAGRSTSRGAGGGLAGCLADRENDIDQGLADPNRNGCTREGLHLLARGGVPDTAGAGEEPVFPPGPNDLDAWRVLLSKRPDVEPAVCRDAHGLACRVDRLRALGNGVVPQQAERAFRDLYGRLMERAS